MQLQVTAFIPDTLPRRDAADEYDLAVTMARSVGGEIACYDVSRDGETWLYGGGELTEDERREPPGRRPR